VEKETGIVKHVAKEQTPFLYKSLILSKARGEGLNASSDKEISLGLLGAVERERE
jgi:hypothetical protein